MYFFNRENKLKFIRVALEIVLDLKSFGKLAKSMQ